MRWWRGLSTASRNESSVHDHADRAGTAEAAGSENGYVSTKDIVWNTYVCPEEKSPGRFATELVGRVGELKLTYTKLDHRTVISHSYFTTPWKLLPLSISTIPGLPIPCWSIHPVVWLGVTICPLI